MIVKLILWIILFFLLNRLLKGFIFMVKGGSAPQPRGAHQSPYKRPGDTYVKSKPEPANRKKDRDEGEYIDYEEIK
jgi:hypothetical protein